MPTYNESDLRMKDLRKSVEKINRELMEYRFNIIKAHSGDTVAAKKLSESSYGLSFWWNKKVGVIVGDESEVSKYGIPT